MRLAVEQPTPPPLPPQGDFIYLNIPRSLKNSIQYLAPSPTSTANLESLFSQNKPQIFPPAAKQDISMFNVY